MKKIFSNKLYLILLPVLFFGSLSAQEMGILKLNSGDLPIHFDKYPIPSTWIAQQNDAVDGRIYRIAFFSQIPTQNQRTVMSEANIRLLDYLPEKAYILSLPVNVDPIVLHALGIKALMPLDARVSLHQDLALGLFPEWSLPDEKHVDVMINVFSDIEENRINALLLENELQILPVHDYRGSRALRVTRSELISLAELPFVAWVEPIYPPSEPENYTGKTLHRSNMLDSEIGAGRHYDGNGIDIMLQDDGIIGPHIDYTGRIGSQNLVNNSGDHGDHIAGTIMGAGNLDPTTKGMAPAATIHTFGASPTYPGFVGMDTYYNTLNIKISSTSYSNGCNAGYTTLARTMDQQIRTLPYLMHVFSAGNDGTSNCSYGAGAGWGNITGGHKVGKNVIAVANLDYKDALSNGSSRGPAHDGRIKPDISAKGSSVYSTSNPNLYVYKSGTSMSCPGVSGTLAQLYHAYRALNNGAYPLGGLMKAIILNSADDIDNPGPDFKTGWGRLNALRAVQTIEEQRFFTDTIAQGDTNYHVLQIPDSVIEFRVMVYWTDYEAFSGVSKALVNDLDAVLLDASSNAYLPWLLDHSPNPVLLNTPAAKGVDNLNNVEQIVVLNPLPGTLTLRVVGSMVPQGPQSYFVVYEYLNDELKLSYPIGGEAFAPGENISIRWDALGSTQPFLLEYSANDGQTWTLINSNVNASRRYYDWTVPTAPTGKMRVRVSRGTYSSMSEQGFSIMGIPQGLNVNWACKDSFSVNWNAVSGAEAYVVYLLGNAYMDSIGYSTSTSYTLTGVNENQEYWVSVSALGPNQAKGRRAIAYLKTSGIWNCVFPYDASIEVISPAPGIHPDCIDHSAVPVKVKINNKGSQPLSNIPVSFSLNFAGTISGTYTGTIPPGSSAVFDLGQTINLPLPGNYFITAVVDHPDDSNSFNNTFDSRVRIVQGASLTNGSLEDFESFSSCSVISDCEYNCSLSNAWWNAENGAMDEADWRSIQGITPTSGTGPMGDHSTATGNGSFLYIEASGDCYNKSALLISPCLDLSQMPSPVLEFWYNMFGADMGSLHVDLLDGAEWIENIIAPVQGNQGQAWKKASIDLNLYSGKKVALRFRGYTGSGQLSDMAIDDILLTDATAIPEINAGNMLMQVFPNPAYDRLFINLQSKSSLKGSAVLTDITGKVVYSQPIDIIIGENQFLVPLEKVSNGTYFVQLTTDQFVVRSMIQVQR